MSMVRDLRRKRFTKRVSFEFTVKEWRVMDGEIYLLCAVHDHIRQSLDVRHCCCLYAHILHQKQHHSVIHFTGLARMSSANRRWLSPRRLKTCQTSAEYLMNKTPTNQMTYDLDGGHDVLFSLSYQYGVRAFWSVQLNLCPFEISLYQPMLCISGQHIRLS